MVIAFDLDSSSISLRVRGTLPLWSGMKKINFLLVWVRLIALLVWVWLIETFFKVTLERPLLESSNTEHDNDCHFSIYRWILFILTELICLVKKRWLCEFRWNICNSLRIIKIFPQTFLIVIFCKRTASKPVFRNNLSE